MKRSLLAAGLCGLLLSGPLATTALADGGDAPVYGAPIYTSPGVVTNHSSSLDGRISITVILVLLLIAAAVAAN